MNQKNSDNPNKESQVASGYKIASHRERVLAYLRGEAIFPVSLELDLTSRCSRACQDCPSTRSQAHWQLSEEFVESLFFILAGRVQGLLLTGGEPTISPLFPKTLALARERGFRDIVVVTNGSHLDQDDVRDSLLAHASTIRVSLYDWEETECAGADLVFARLETLRGQIDSQKSSLRIGVSALTSTARLGQLEKLVETAIVSGVHWIYFHPRCRNWDRGRPQPEEQTGVLDEIRRLQRKFSDKIEIDVLEQRYHDFALRFSGYHAAHFLLVVGADRKNYLGPEVKYHPDFVMADMNNGWREDFLWQPERIKRVAYHNSGNYQAMGSRHRGVLYNDYIERLKRREPAAEKILSEPPLFRYPHIL